MDDKNMLIKQYSMLILKYEKMKKYLLNELENLLILNGVHYQSISSRLKSIESLSEKLDKNDILLSLKGDIKNLNDLVGVRIILYDYVNLNKVIDIIKEKYKICDYKGKRMEYNANNITIKMDEKEFIGFKCEIQLVTVMSHNLIEIGHDFIYKNSKELEKLDEIEFLKIKESYNSCLEEVYKLENKIDNIKQRATNIKENYKLYEYIVSDDYINKIINNKSLPFFYECTNKYISIIPFLSRNSEKARVFIDKKIILKLCESLEKLENDSLFSHEFVFSNFMNLMYSYEEIWLSDISKVFEFLFKYIFDQNNERISGDFFDMISNTVINDYRNDKSTTIQQLKDWILNGTDYSEYRIKIANCIIVKTISYIEEESYLNMNVKTQQIKYNEDGKKIINRVFSHCCDIFIKNQSKKTFEELVHLVYKVPYLCDSILSFFDKNYYLINDIYKFDLIRKIYYSHFDKVSNNSFYDKVKKDSKYEIYKFLVYDFFDEEFERKDHEKISEKSKRVIRKYIKNINNKSYDEALGLLKCYDSLILDKYTNVGKFQRFLYEIGKSYNFAKKLYRYNKNPYIYMGLRTVDSKIKIRTDIDVLMALKSCFIDSVFSDIVLNPKKDVLYNSQIIDIIISNKLYIKKKYMTIIMDLIDRHNKRRSFVLDKVYIGDDFVEHVSENEIDSILDNYKYSIYQKTIFFDINSMAIFNKYPENFRRFISILIKNKRNHSFRFPIEMSITSSNNFDVERIKNISFILQYLEKYEFFEIYKYVENLFSPYDKKNVDDLIRILDMDSSYKTCLVVSKFLCNLDLGLDIWPVVKKILCSVKNDSLNNNCFAALTNVGGVSSFAETYDQYEKELKNIKKKEKNDKIKSFLNRLIKFFHDNKSYEKFREFNYRSKFELKYNSNK